MHKIVKFLIPLLLIDCALADTSNMLEIPRHLPKPNSGSYLLKNFQDKNSSVIELTLDHELQSKLTAFVKNQGNHIAALIVAEVETGNIIAMVQGKNPTYWGSKEHATLHTGFPAASLFKFASTIASLETLNLNPRKATGLRGGCARVNPSGTWLKDQSPVPNFRMSLKRAFALSCNGYYAQLGIKELGMGPILHFAEKLGFWPYLIAGCASWYGFQQAGVHPALGLLPIVVTIPHADITFGMFDSAKLEQHDLLNDIEHKMKLPVEFILLLFGFANAGVEFSAMGEATWLVLAGLIVGKPVGIFIMGWLAAGPLRLGLPEGMKLNHLIVIGFIAAIGFTVSLFISAVAFAPGDVQDAAKMGALFSFGAVFLSLIAGRIMRVEKQN